MAKINLSNVLTLLGINSNFQRVEDELNNKVLYRDNPVGEPNTMETPLDMNGQRVFNLPLPLDLNEPARLADIANNASATALKNDLASTSDSNKGAALIGGLIANSVTLNVPSQYASITAALNFLADKTIARNAIVTIQVADGVYVQSAVNFCAHPQGIRIKIIGNTTVPTNCILQCATSDAFYVPAGFELGEINGFSLVKTGAKTQIGVLSDSGLIAKLGPKIEIDGFYYGVAARGGASIIADGTSISNRVLVKNAGDAAFWSYKNSYISAQFAEAQNANDSGNGLGTGFVAEYGGNIDATGSKATSCFLAGYGVLTTGSLRGFGITSQTNGNGINLKSNGRIEVFNSAVITNNTNYGYISDGTTVPNGWSTATTSPNGIGEFLLTPTDNAAFTSATILGGTINNTTLGATTRSTAAFTTLNANGLFTLDGGGPRIDFNTGGPNVRVPTTNVLALSNGLAEVARLSASSNLLVATTGDDGTGNKLQVNGGISITPATTTVAPGAGGAGALPATPAGYATIRIAGVDRKIAFY